MNRSDPHGFRVFLHLASLRAGQEALARTLNLLTDELPPDPFKTMAEGLGKAQKARAGRDWLGYEMEMFRIATHAFRALEEHQTQVGAATFHARTRWCWESTRQPGVVGSWPTRAQAIAHAEAELPAGETFRVGRRAASPLHRYVPKTETLVRQMRDRARLEHEAPELQWPELDLRQHEELQSLLEGLLVAFMEREGLNLSYMSWVDVESLEVPVPAGEGS
jgi:hypothetical protein